MTYIAPLDLGCAAENLVPSADTGANLVVLGFRVAERVELGLTASFSTRRDGMYLGTHTNEAMREPPNQTA